MKRDLGIAEGEGGEKYGGEKGVKKKQQGREKRREKQKRSPRNLNRPTAHTQNRRKSRQRPGSRQRGKKKRAGERSLSAGYGAHHRGQERGEPQEIRAGVGKMRFARRGESAWAKVAKKKKTP